MLVTLAVGTLAAIGLGTMIYFQQEEIDRMHDDAAGLRTKIDDGRTLVRGTPTVEREVIIQRETDEVIKGILPNEADINTFVKTLQSFGEKSGVLISQIKSRNNSSRKKGKQDFQEEGYTLTFKADAFQLLSFLDSIETHERFMSVPGFKLSASKRRGIGGQEASLHQLTMDVVTYVYAPKDGSSNLKIEGYDRKRDLLLGEIAKRRGELVVEGFDYRGARGRRDPWVDPRVPVAGDGPILSVEDQIALVDGLVDRAERVTELWAEFQDADNLISEMKARNSLLEELVPLEDEVRRIEEEGQLLFISAERRFDNEVVSVITDVRGRIENADPGRGPSAVALRESLDTMRTHLESGEYELALAAYEAIEPRLPLVEGDDLRMGLVEQLRKMENVSRAVVDFGAIPLDIKGVIVNSGGAVAVINGRSVSAGEMLDAGVIVQSIQSNEIEFLYQGISLVRQIEEQ
jgi:hypothetical protein